MNRLSLDWAGEAGSDFLSADCAFCVALLGDFVPLLLLPLEAQRAHESFLGAGGLALHPNGARGITSALAVDFGFLVTMWNFSTS